MYCDYIQPVLPSVFSLPFPMNPSFFQLVLMATPLRKLTVNKQLLFPYQTLAVNSSSGRGRASWAPPLSVMES